MRTMSEVKIISKEELYWLLSACYESLTQAYQESNDNSFWQIAIQARLACDSLSFEISSQQKIHQIH